MDQIREDFMNKDQSGRSDELRILVERGNSPLKTDGINGKLPVLAVWEHGANLGHIARLISVARSARDQGAHVLFALPSTQAMSVARGAVASAGFICIPAPCISPAVPQDGSEPSLNTLAPGGHSVNHAEVLLRCAFGDVSLAWFCIQQWLSLLHRLNPASVLVDASPLALYASRAGGWPVLALGHGFELPSPVGGTPSLTPLWPCFTPWLDRIEQIAEQAQERLHLSLSRLRDLSTKAGLPGNSIDIPRSQFPETLQGLFRPEDAALCTWPELDHIDRYASAWTYYGPIWDESAAAPTVAWPNKLGCRVLCYLNLRDKRYDLLWQALLRQGANVVVLSPRGVARAAEAARGWGITVVEQSVHLAPLLAKAHAVIGHGGMGFTAMALHAGKPLLLLPEHMEQGILAHRLSRQGLAVATIRLRDKSGMQAKVERLLTDPALSRNASRVRQRYAQFTSQAAARDVAARWVQKTHVSRGGAFVGGSA